MNSLLNLLLIIAGLVIVIFFTHTHILWFDGWALGALLIGMAALNVFESRSSNKSEDNFLARFLKDALGVKDKK